MVRTRSMCIVCLVAACMAVLANSAFAQLRDSFEKTPLLKEPKTPEEMFGVTLLMVDLARVDLAKQYLEQFLATNPDDEMLLKLRDQHGAGDFLKIQLSFLLSHPNSVTHVCSPRLFPYATTSYMVEKSLSSEGRQADEFFHVGGCFPFSLNRDE